MYGFTSCQFLPFIGFGLLFRVHQSSSSEALLAESFGLGFLFANFELLHLETHAGQPEQQQHTRSTDKHALKSSSSSLQMHID